MKKIFTRLLPGIVLSVALFAACEKEEKEPDAAPSFPDSLTEDVLLYPEAEASVSDEDSMESEYDIVFTPNNNWTISLSSGASRYFELRYGATEAQSVRGPASDSPQTVTIVCIATDRDLEEAHKADISMTMGGETRELGTVMMPAKEISFKAYAVSIKTDGESQTFEEAESGSGLTYKYSSEPADENTVLTMIWNNVEAVYESYLLIDSNTGFRQDLENSGSELELLNYTENGNLTELRISCRTTSLDERKSGFALLVEENGEEVPYSFTVKIPAFEADFFVYPVEKEENGDYVISDDETFTMSYSSDFFMPGDKIQLEYVSENMQFETYILVEGNYDYVDISQADEDGGKPAILDGLVPEWLSVKALGSEGNKKEFCLSVIPENMLLDGAVETLVFQDGTSPEISNRYNIALPGCRDFFEIISNEETATFDYQGKYYNTMQGQYLEGGASIEVASANDLKVYAFSVDENGNYAANPDWLHASWTWDNANLGKLQQNPVTITADENEGRIREGLVMALPATLAGEISGAADLVSGDAVKPEYEAYVISTIMQASHPSAPGIIMQEDAAWTALGGNLTLLKNDEMAEMAEYAYLVTYSWNGWGEGSTTFGSELTFKINLDFDPSKTQVYEAGAASGDMTLVEDPEKYWIQLSESGENYCIKMTPADPGNVKSATVYFALMDSTGEKIVAIIKFVYDNDVSLDLKLESGTGFSLRQSTSDEITVEGLNPTICWTLEYSGDGTAQAVISGVPEVIYIQEPTAEWLSYESLGNGKYAITVSPEAGNEDMEGYINFSGGNMQSMNLVLHLLVKLN